MARKHPRRRLMAKIALYDDLARRTTSQVNGEDMSMLQQGRVQCALERNAKFMKLAVPRATSLEGTGKPKNRTMLSRKMPDRAWSFDYTQCKGYAKPSK